MCVVCSEANDDLILTADVVETLMARRSYDINVARREDEKDDEDEEGKDDENNNGMEVQSQVEFQQTNGSSNSNVRNETETDVGNNCTSNARKASAEALQKEQLEDETLKGWWSLAKRGKGSLFVKDGLLYRNERILGQEFTQLCLPKNRRSEVLTMAHDTFGGHLGTKRTQDRIRHSPIVCMANNGVRC